MPNEFTAVFERDGEWHIAYCPEIPGANGQGRTKEGARSSAGLLQMLCDPLIQALALFFGLNKDSAVKVRFIFKDGKNPPAQLIRRERAEEHRQRRQDTPLV